MYQITKNTDRGSDHKPGGNTRTAPAPTAAAPTTSTTLPMSGITTPQDMDILCGRGGTAFRHRGNQIYRDLVNRNKGFYSTCPKPEKPKISRSIVAAIRERNGRFLEKNNATDTWYDIGDKKAIEKTSQALREGQAKRREKIIKGETTAKTSPTSAKPVTAPSVYVPPGAPGTSPKVHHSAPPPPPYHPPQPADLVAQQEDSFLRVIDDEVLQHLDSMKSLTLQDDGNFNNPEALMPTLEGRGSVPQQLGMKPQKSDFSLMSDFSAFGGGGTGQSTRSHLSAMSMGTTKSPQSSLPSNDSSGATSRNSQLEDGMPAIYMIDSANTLLSNISSMSGTTTSKKPQQQHWSAGVASVNPNQQHRGGNIPEQHLPVVMEGSGSHHNSSSEITVQRPPDASSAGAFDGAMLTDDFYQQAKQGMMKSSSGHAKDHSNPTMAPPPAVPFHHQGQQQQQQQSSMNSLLQNSVMESSLSLQSNMSAITMTTLTTTADHYSNTNPSQGQQQQQQHPWRRMPNSPSAGAAGRQEDIAEEDDDGAADNHDEYDATSYFSLTDTLGPEYSANSVMSGLSKISISDTSLQDVFQTG